MANKLSDQELKAKLIAKTQHESKTSQFPTEIVPLPSKGLVYPKDHPLSSGEVELKYMTAKEEDILTNTNLLRSGKALDKLYESLIIGNGNGEPVFLKDMITGDKSAIMLAARILGYGNEYDIILQNSKGEEFEYTVDLNKLNVKEVDYSIYNNSRILSYTLPVSGKEIEFKLRNNDEEAQLVRALDKATTSPITTALKHTILSIDGDSDEKFINDFVDNHMLAKDSLQLRSYINSVTPDYDLTVFVDSPENGYSQNVQLPIDTNFFWPRV